MSWGCPGLLKSRSGMDMVSKKWETLKSLFRGYFPLGSWDIQALIAQIFDHVTSSNLQL